MGELVMVDPLSPDLPPLDSEEFLPSIRGWQRLGALLLVGTGIGAVAIAAFTSYTQTVQAPGWVRPLGEVSIVQAEIEGKISRVLVQANQSVQAGDRLIELASADPARLRQLQARQARLQQFIQQYEAQETRLNRQLRSLEASIRQQIPAKAPDIAIAALLETLAVTQPGTASNLQTQRNSLLQQRDGIVKQLRLDRATLQDVTQAIDQQQVKAPVAGIILKLDIRNPGQTVRPGEILAQIVPRTAPLVVKARVAPQDISQLALGQPVRLQISAYPYPDYGTLAGTVQAIAPDITPPSEQDPAPFYEVTIQPATPHLKRGDRTYPLQPGMDVRASITTGQEPLLNTLMRRIRLGTGL
jgi:HlyD family secretion protein